MDLIEQSFKQLYPEKKFNYETKILYSGKFKSYNANIRLMRRFYERPTIELRISYDFQEVDDDIKIGLVQELLIKVFNDRRKTDNIDFYNNFVRHLGSVAQKTDIDPELKESFDRVNEKYFFGRMEVSNLVWGKQSFSKLGCYEYKSDTITMSTIFHGERELLDYVMYHEMLHKKFKFRISGSKMMHHTGEFKKAEEQFENFHLIENKIKAFIVSKKRIGRKARSLWDFFD